MKTAQERKTWSPLGVVCTLLMPVFALVYLGYILQDLRQTPYDIVNDEQIIQTPRRATFICEAPSGCFVDASYNIQFGASYECAAALKNHTVCVFVPYKTMASFSICNSPEPDDGIWVLWKEETFQSTARTMPNPMGAAPVASGASAGAARAPTAMRTAADVALLAAAMGGSSEQRRIRGQRELAISPRPSVDPSPESGGGTGDAASPQPSLLPSGGDTGGDAGDAASPLPSTTPLPNAVMQPSPLPDTDDPDAMRSALKDRMDNPNWVPDGLRFVDRYGQNALRRAGVDERGGLMIDSQRDSTAWSEYQTKEGEVAAQGQAASGPVPFESSAEQEVLASAGVTTDYSYHDYNVLGGEAFVGLSVQSDILLLEAGADGVSRVRRLLSALPLTRGRHVLSSHQSSLTGTSFLETGSLTSSLTASETIEKQGWMLLTTDKSAAPTSESAVRARATQGTCILGVLFHLNATEGPQLFVAQHPAAMELQALGLLPGVTREHLRQKAYEIYYSLPEEGQMDTVGTGLLSQQTGWRLAQITLSGRGTTATISPRGWTWVFGSLGGFVSLLMTVLLGVVLVMQVVCPRNALTHGASVGDMKGDRAPLEREAPPALASASDFSTTNPILRRPQQE